MFQPLEQLHFISTENNLELVPEKSFFMLLKVKLLGHEIGYNTIKPIYSKIAAIHKIPSPTGKVAQMIFICVPNLYTKFIEKIHNNLKPFNDLSHKNISWTRNFDLSHKNISTIHPQNITLSIQYVFITYMDKLIEHKENLVTPLYLHFHLESQKEKHDYFEVPDLGTKIQRHDNPHYWLQQDILQINNSNTDSFRTSY